VQEPVRGKPLEINSLKNLGKLIVLASLVVLKFLQEHLILIRAFFIFKKFGD